MGAFPVAFQLAVAALQTGQLTDQCAAAIVALAFFMSMSSFLCLHVSLFLGLNLGTPGLERDFVRGANLGSDGMASSLMPGENNLTN